MIAFATLLLGLVIGPQPIELLVGDPVARVELLLDGRQIATLHGGPWTASCDFGPRLEPHELVAIAFDAADTEVGRTRQWVNTPHLPAETSLVLEGGEEGSGLIARVSWESVVDTEPTAVVVTFDGSPLEATDPRRIEIPPFDPDQLHHLRVELDFSNNVSSVVETTFAGTFVNRIDYELTAIPMLLDKRAREPTAAELAGHFSKRSRPLAVAAVERGPAEIIIVRDESARRDLNRMHRHDESALWRRARGGGRVDRASARTALPLPEDLMLRFLWPASSRQQRAGYELDVFPPSRELTSRDGGLFWLLTYTRQPLFDAPERRYADAVAAAGLLAAGRNRRRAVVLLLGSDRAPDASQFRLAEVERYLDLLGVPLFVWTTERRAQLPGLERGASDVSTISKLGRSTRDLYDSLDRQRIVWVKGTHLPQQVSIEEGNLPFQQLP